MVVDVILILRKGREFRLAQSLVIYGRVFGRERSVVGLLPAENLIIQLILDLSKTLTSHYSFWK